MSTISGYTTCLDTMDAGSPLLECLESMARFCAEVVVVDGGSTDGTWEFLTALAAEIPWLKPHREPIDRERPRWAIAAEIGLAVVARSRCEGEFCCFVRPEEVVADGAAERVRALVEHWPEDVDVIAMPAVEYWGSVESMRADIPLARPRLSRNLDHLTHGVPRELRRFDDDGEVYLARFHRATDGLIDARDHGRARVSSLVDPTVEKDRREALRPDREGRVGRCHLQRDLARLLEEVPVVFDVSSLDLERKVDLYRRRGALADASLFDYPSLCEGSPFGKPWRDVTDEEARTLATDLLAAGPPQGAGRGPLVRCGKLPPSGLAGWIVARLPGSEGGDGAWA